MPGNCECNRFRVEWIRDLLHFLSNKNCRNNNECPRIDNSGDASNLDEKD